MFVKRQLQKAFETASSHFPAVLLIGARQVGKTTFLRHISEPERKYVSLDDMASRTLANDDPAGFLDRFSPPVLIDEIQYAPKLLNAIKILVDEVRFKDKKNSNGLFWLTGSQQFQMMKGVSESLAGRVAILDMLGLSQAELDERASQPFLPTNEFPDSTAVKTPELFRRIWQGSYPEIYNADEMKREFFYSGYLQTYLERDVRELDHVTDLERFYKFICSVAARTGQLLNYSELARDAEIDIGTSRNWLTILEASRLVYLLRPYAGSLTSRLVKTPKLYMLDTGLCAYLTKWPNPEVLEAGAMAGAFFETWCFIEILKSYFNSGKSHPAFYFYRDKDQKEIDLVIEEAGTLFPVEFKKSATPKKEDCRHFSVLGKFKKPIGTGALISMYPTMLPQREANCKFIPAPLL